MPPTDTIPVVDLGRLSVGLSGGGSGGGEDEVDETELWRVGEALVQALSSVGFVALKNHGIDDGTVQAVVDAAAALFALPVAVKEAHQKDLTLGHGYVGLSREQLHTTSGEMRESFDIRCLEGRLPDEVPALKPALTPFVAACTILARRLLTALALGLGLEREFFASRHRAILSSSYTNSSVMRLNHYPPLPAAATAATEQPVVRCGAHTDWGSITLLFQDDTGGLQVRGAGGAWVDAAPTPGSVLLNAGDLLQLWTARRLLATEHRVVAPGQGGAASSRYSLAFFVHPEDSVLVQATDGSAAEPPRTARQHLLDMFAKTYVY